MVYEKEQALKDHYNSYPRGGTTIDDPRTLRSILDIAKCIVQPNSDVLDLGCASGVVSEMIRTNYDVNVTGVDFAFSRILIGKKERPGVKFIKQDIHEFVKTTKLKFDLIILFEWRLYQIAHGRALAAFKLIQPKRSEVQFLLW